MIRIFVFIFVLVNSSTAVCQKLFVTNDTSRLIFPNNVAIEFAKKSSNKASGFQLSQPALKTLIVQWNYVYGMLDANLKRVDLLEKELMIRDSTVQALKKQLQISDERLSVYSSGYENVKEIASRYDTQVKALIEELDTIRKNDRKVKRRTLSKGLVAGFTGGVAITSLVILRKD